MANERRSEDPRISKLVEDVEKLTQGLAENNKTTEQVRDILTSFRAMGLLAKWVAAIAGGVLAVKHGMDVFGKQ